MDVLLDCINIFGIFFGGVGVVETQVTLTAELPGCAEIHADGFGVSDVEIAVGLGWETGVYHLSRRILNLAGLYVGSDGLFDKIETFLFFDIFWSSCHFSLKF